MITKTGSILGRTLKFNTDPIGLGAISLGVGSGESVGESIGMGLGGVAGYEAGTQATKGLMGKSKRLAKYAPGKLGKTLGVIGGLAASFPGSEIGRHIGSKKPIWQRGNNTIGNKNIGDFKNEKVRTFG